MKTEKLMKHCLHRNVLRKQIPSRTIRVRCKSCRKTMPKTALQFWSKNKEMPLTLSSKGYTQGTEQYFSLCCSQMTSRPPERENSSKLHVNFTAIGATSGAAVTSSTLGRRLGILQNDNRERKSRPNITPTSDIENDDLTAAYTEDKPPAMQGEQSLSDGNSSYI